MPSLRLNFGLALLKAGALKEAIEVFTPLLNQDAPGSAEAQRLRMIVGMAP
jgi:hypothetical protein